VVPQRHFVIFWLLCDVSLYCLWLHWHKPFFA
jgi:hypothetical protein